MNSHKYSKNNMTRIAYQMSSTNCTHTKKAQDQKSWSSVKYCIQNENNKSRQDISSMIYIYRNISKWSSNLARLIT